MGKSLRNISDSDVSDDLPFKSLSLRVAELENALCNQDKLLCKVFYENKKLNLELESFCSEIASLWSVHNDMSAKPCENCKMVMVNYANLLLVTLKLRVKVAQGSTLSGHDLLEFLLLVPEAVLLLVALAIVILVVIVILIGGVELLPHGTVGDEVGGVTALDAAPR
jgi:hypothetical protein